MKTIQRFYSLLLLSAGLGAALPACAQFDMLRTMLPQVQAAGDMAQVRKHAAQVGQIQRLAGAGDIKEALRLAEDLVAEEREPHAASLMSLRGNLLRQSAGIAADLHERGGNHGRAIELHRMLLDARMDPQGELSSRRRIGELQEKVGDHVAALDTYRQVLAMPSMQHPHNRHLRGALHGRVGRAATMTGDYALAESSLQLALDDSMTIPGPAGTNAPAGSAAAVEAMTAFGNAFARAREMSAALAANQAVTDAGGQMVSGPGGGWSEKGVLDVESPIIDLAALYYRMNDAAALKALYAGKFSGYARRTRQQGGGQLQGNARLEQEYARFGGYLAGLRQHDLAGDAFAQALALNASRLQLTVVQVPPEMLAVSFATRRQILDMLLSQRLAAQAGTGEWRGPLGELLQAKALQSEYLARRARAIGISRDPQVRRLAARMESIDALGTVERRAARLNLAVDLQAKIGKTLAPLSFDDGAQFVLRAQERLGAQTLVSVSAFTVFDFATQKFRERRYFGASIAASGIRVADLGPAEALDALAGALRAELAGRPRAAGSAGAVLPSARRAYDFLLKPLLGARAPAGAWVADLDGALSLLPMEALADGAGRYLIELGPWRYVSSARVLLRDVAAGASGKQAVVLADPAYGARAARGAVVAGASRGIALRSLQFDALPETRAEGEAVAAALGRAGASVALHSGASASLDTLMQMSAPRYLHIATHGFFIEEAGIRREQVAAPDGRTYVHESYADGLSSGLALAGANATLAAGSGNGVLYAAQLRQLDLNNTELAVLSACDTGVGAVRAGEGVDSLRQALEVAGARTMVTSLWPVPDVETRVMMTAFYDVVANGGSKAGALRDAKLRIRQRYPHPYYWASFVMTGMP
ncbi:MAG: CHAT domain-containing protein [Telluria sp.]